MPPNRPPAPPHGLDSHDALRLRFWIGGRLRDEVWIDASNPKAGDLAEYCATYHAAQAELADAAGVAWLVEVYNPELPDEHAYVRFGTDSAGMVDPHPLNGFGA